MVFIRPSSQLPSPAITTTGALHPNNNYNCKKRLSSSSFYNILFLVTISILPLLYLLGITNYLTNSTTVRDDERRMHNLKKKKKKLDLTDIADIMYNSRLKLTYQCLDSRGSSHANNNSELRDLIARTDQVIIL